MNSVKSIVNIVSVGALLLLSGSYGGRLFGCSLGCTDGYSWLVGGGGNGCVVYERSSCKRANMVFMPPQVPCPYPEYPGPLAFTDVQGCHSFECNAPCPAPSVATADSWENTSGLCTVIPTGELRGVCRNYYGGSSSGWSCGWV